MKYAYQWGVVIVILFTLSCKKQQEEIKSKSEIELFNTSKILDINSIVDSVEYILLEANLDDAIFRDAHKIRFIEDKIYVLDIIGKMLLVFNEDGTFSKKIGQMGNGPGEYVMPSDFDVDLYGNIFIYNGPVEQLLKYDNNNNFIESIKLPFEIDNFSITSNNKFLFSLAKYNSGKSKDYKIVITDSLLNIEKEYLKYEEYYDPNFILETFIQNENNEIVYYKPIDDYVYLFTEDELIEKFHLNFKEKTVPLDLRKDIHALKNKYADNYSFVLTTPIVLKDYLLGMMVDSNKLKFFIYSRINKGLYIDSNPYIFPAAYLNDSTFLSVVNNVIYPLYEENESFSSEQRKHLDDGGTIICKYIMKSNQ